MGARLKFALGELDKMQILTQTRNNALQKLEQAKAAVLELMQRPKRGVGAAGRMQATEEELQQRKATFEQVEKEYVGGVSAQLTRIDLMFADVVRSPPHPRICSMLSSWY